LDPAGYEQLATAVFAEMAVTGWTAAGEFHYLHHAPGGTPYPDHDMERALARAARAAGIRLVLLDTCYLSGGLDADGGALRHGHLRHALAEDEASARVGESRLVTLGTAIDTIPAVPPWALK